jgi:hypothetical protein
VNQIKRFDVSNVGRVKIYHLVNILKFYFKSFSEDTLKNLQFDLECLSGDGTIDYEEFVSVVFKRAGAKETVEASKNESHLPGYMSERNRKRNNYLVEDYNEILLKIN